MEQILVTAGVIVEEGKLLLAQRLPGGMEGGKWEFPGGKVEPSEEPRNGLCRELQEELGITVEVAEILEVVSHVNLSRHLVILYFLCRIKGGIPKAIECQQVCWLTPDEIIGLEKPESDEKFWRWWVKNNYRFNGERS